MKSAVDIGRVMAFPSVAIDRDHGSTHNPFNMFPLSFLAGLVTIS
jgi:hypothetical protein